MSLATRALVLLVLLQVGPAAALAAPLPPDAAEELQYRVSLGIWENVGQARVVLKPLGPGHYLAEFSFTAPGVWKLLKRWLPERYQTEMACHQGRFRPLIFREELHLKGKHILKEYRFDYDRGRLEYWRRVEDQEPVKKWEIPLAEPLYDPLTLLYNLRLGGFGPLPSGETLRLFLIPTPEPEEVEIRIGSRSAQGLKVMLAVKETASGAERGPFFVNFGPEWVPEAAWYQLPLLGKLTGRLLATGAALREKLGAPPSPVIKSAGEGQ